MFSVGSYGKLKGGRKDSIYKCVPLLVAVFENIKRSSLNYLFLTYFVNIFDMIYLSMI